MEINDNIENVPTMGADYSPGVIRYPDSDGARNYSYGVLMPESVDGTRGAYTDSGYFEDAEQGVASGNKSGLGVHFDSSVESLVNTVSGIVAGTDSNGAFLENCRQASQHIAFYFRNVNSRVYSTWENVANTFDQLNSTVTTEIVEFLRSIQEFANATAGNEAEMAEIANTVNEASAQVINQLKQI